LAEDLLLLGRQLLLDRASQPAHTVAAVGFEGLASGVAEVDQCAAAVSGIGRPGDQALCLQIAEGLGHRLWTHALCRGEVAGALRPVTVEATEHGAVGEREAMLGPQPAHELTQHRA
jgi:hypothetical protein